MHWEVDVFVTFEYKFTEFIRLTIQFGHEC